MSKEPDYEAIEVARALAAEVAARADAADRAGALPAEDVAALRDAGYLALAVPVAFGGRGASLLTCDAAQMALAQGSASTALVAAMQHQVIGHQRETRSWRPDAYERIMQEAVAGGLLNHLGSEPQMGSPSRGGLPATTAEPTSDGERPVSYTHLRAHETVLDLVCRLLLEKKKTAATNIRTNYTP